MTQANSAATNPAIFADPLKVMGDMEAKWLNFGEGVPFDNGVAHLLKAHEADGGTITDIEVSDLREQAFGTLDKQHLVIANPRTGQSFKLRRTAWSGLMDRMKVGQGGTDLLLRRLPPQLQEANLNVMLRRMTEKVPAVLRVRGGDVLAIVSTRYAPIDTPEIVDIARDTLNQQGLLNSAMVRAVSWGGRDIIRVSFPERDKAVKVDDIVSKGLDFRNGSWGGSAVSLATSTVRLVCLNGMTRDESGHTSFHFKHVGTREKITERVRNALPQALASGDDMVARFEQAINTEVGNIGKMFSFLGDALQVGEQEQVRHQLKEELGVPVLNPKDAFSLFHAVNALTAVARDLSPERRLVVESSAGSLLYANT
jgi:hypothetical protein